MQVLRNLPFFVFFLVFLASSSEAGWLIYHEPEFKGKILDIDTKQPIEGAVVVVEYQKETMEVGAGNVSSIINVRETLTDPEGRFRFPAYTTMIQPFSWQISPAFIIYKPGYAKIDELTLKNYFDGSSVAVREGQWAGPEMKGFIYTLRPGVVELPKLKTLKQRWLAHLITIEGYLANDLPLLYMAIEKEKVFLNQTNE